GLHREQGRAGESQKMEALGRLAGGVAHDFNNLLTVILGYADVLSRRLESDASGQSYVLELRRAAERAAALTRKLLAFGQRAVVAPTVLDLRESLRELRPVLERALGGASHLDIELPDEPMTVRADPGHLEQVLL